MKVLHVITGLGTGGAETMLYWLLSCGSIAEREHRVVCLGGGGAVGEQIKALGIHVDVLGGKGRRSALRVTLGATRIARAYRPDIIQGWMYDGNLAAWWVAKRCGANLAWNVRHSVEDISCEPFDLRLVIRLCALVSTIPDAIIYNSHVAAGQHEALGFVTKRNRILPNGFDTLVFKPDAVARTRIRSELGIPDSALLIGKIARYHPMKDHINFIKAAGELLHSVPEARFLLAGAGIHNGNRVLLKAVKQAGIHSRIYFLGERQDMPAINAALDIAVSSSAWGEGFSNAIGEAMACGVPCVVTDVGDGRKIVGESGIVVPPKNPVLMMEALLTLYRMGPVGRRALGEQARARIIERWSLDSVRRQYLALYQELSN